MYIHARIRKYVRGVISHDLDFAFARCTFGNWACTAGCVVLGQTSGGSRTLLIMFSDNPPSYRDVWSPGCLLVFREKHFNRRLPCSPPFPLLPRTFILPGFYKSISFLSWFWCYFGDSLCLVFANLFLFYHGFDATSGIYFAWFLQIKICFFSNIFSFDATSGHL